LPNLSEGFRRAESQPASGVASNPCIPSQSEEPGIARPLERREDFRAAKSSNTPGVATGIFRKIAAQVLRASLLIAIAGLAAGLPGCGGSTAPAKKATTVTPRDLNKGGTYYDSLSPAQDRQLAALCLKSHPQIGVSADRLASALNTFYSGEHGNIRIRDACAQAVSRSLPDAALTVENPSTDALADSVSLTARSATVVLRGTVNPGNATVTVAEAKLNTGGTDGWSSERKASVRAGQWRVLVPVRNAGDNNSYRVTAQSRMYKRVRMFVGINRKGTVAQEQAAKARRALDRQQSRQRSIAKLTRSFSGNGGKNLGTVHVPKDSTLRWTCDGDLFTVTDDTSGLFVNSQAHSGDSAVAAGTYTGVSVNALGNWTITISPNG
jgi:hypothetical protein